MTTTVTKTVTTRRRPLGKIKGLSPRGTAEPTALVRHLRPANPDGNLSPAQLRAGRENLLGADRAHRVTDPA